MNTPELSTFLYALVALLVIVDPVGTAVVYAALTPYDTPAERASQARRACLVAAIVLGVFGLAAFYGHTVYVLFNGATAPGSGLGGGATATGPINAIY